MLSRTLALPAVDGARLASASGMEDREMGVTEKQLLPAARPHAKLLEGRLGRASGRGHCCSTKLSDPGIASVLN